MSFLSSAKCLKESFLTPCSITSLKESCLLNVTQFFLPGDSSLPESHNSFPLHTRYINFLLVTLQWIFPPQFSKFFLKKLL